MPFRLCENDQTKMFVVAQNEDREMPEAEISAPLRIWSHGLNATVSKTKS
jgi:hypothetical protein